jgi:hypothetical protein
VIVSRIRDVGRGVGKVLDEEDRRVIGTVLVLAVTVLLAAVTLATAVGLAIRVFEYVSGV